ncbi:MAG: hypothetical protein FWE24_05690 [Defluviitaleaceae bacterium]|nr:hypothetical protein [Defluviitaleaceae bacterium]
MKISLGYYAKESAKAVIFLVVVALLGWGLWTLVLFVLVILPRWLSGGFS